MVRGIKKKEEDADFEYYTKNILMDPMLLDRIVLDGLDEKVVGEDKARKTIFMCAMGARVLNGKPTSFNLMVNSESGAGKDHVTSTVLKIFPKDDLVKRTRITPTVLTYWKPKSRFPNWSWDGKILYLEDCGNNVLNSEVFKVYASGGTHTTVVKDQVAVDIEIVGKAVIILTSASANPHCELIRRFMVVNLTESEDQTKEIMKRWGEHNEAGEVPKEENDYHDALKYILPKKVKVPFARRAAELMPSGHIHMRTHFPRFMDFVKASAVLHQWQRETDEQDHLLAEQADYEVAKQIMLATSSNELMIPLTQNQNEVIGILKELGKNIVESESGHEIEVGWTVQELTSKLPFSVTQLRRELNRLMDFGFIEKSQYQFHYDKKKTNVYSYKETKPLVLPNWDEIHS